jgi:NADH:ubiquinone oxidoreductase subunit B-like Fe-S oxidoreductase
MNTKKAYQIDAWYWLKVFVCLLVCLPISQSYGQAPNITQAEYFWDTDPGFGNGTNIPIASPAPVLNNQNISINIQTLTEGFHNLYLRSKDANDSWSVTNKVSLVKLNTANLPNPNIVYAEYFWDTDPGFGSGTAISITPGTSINNLTIPINITSLANGFHNLFIRSKDLNGNWSITNSVSMVKINSTITANPNIIKCEYILDDMDPGFGNGINIPFTPGQVITNQALNINIQPLIFGPHSVTIRSMDANGVWSISNRVPFYKVKPLDQTPWLAKTEYFIDTDPGFGNATTIATHTDSVANNLSTSINIASLSLGFHQLYMRSMDTNKVWGVTNRVPFCKLNNPAANPNVVKAEYFIDTDPGFGNATNIPITASTTINSIALPINIASLNNGFHDLYLRTQDSLGHWSVTNKVHFMKDVVPAAGAIVKVEYFWDTDPGLGNATNIPITSTNTVTSSFTANITALSEGFHNFYMRSLDAHGKWSVTNRTPIFKEIPQPATNIVKAEYFVDNNDPGFGNATNIPIATPSNPLNNQNFTAIIGNLPVGTHHLWIRSKDARDKWSVSNAKQFTISGPVTGPSILVAGNPIVTNCFGDSTGKIIASAPVLVNPPVSYAIYPSLGTQSPAGTFINLPAGTYSLVGTDNNTNRDTAIVIVPNAPQLFSNAIAANPLCFGSGTNLLSASASGGTGAYSYTWFNSSNTSVGTGVALSNQTTGTYYVRTTDAKGCTALSGTVTLVNPTQVIASAGVSSAILCKHDNATVTVTGTGGTPYVNSFNPPYLGHGNYSVPAGTYTYNITDANGCTASTTITVTQPAIAYDSVTSVLDSAIKCNGGSTRLKLNPVGGYAPYVYRYHPPFSTPVVITNSFTVSAGNYLFSATDSNGCIRYKSITVTQPAPIVINTVQNAPIACHGGSTSVTVSVTSGGTAPYIGTGTFTVTAGGYSYTITDVQGCTNAASIGVSQPSPLGAYVVVDTAINCARTTEVIHIVGTGGTTPYANATTYSLTPGTYTFTVTDAGGCGVTVTHVVGSPSFAVNTSVFVPIKCKGDSAQIIVTTVGGNAPFVGVDTFTVAAGTHTFVVNDAVGCVAQAVVTLTEPNALLAPTLAIVQPLCYADSADITIAATGGIAPYTGTGIFKVIALPNAYTFTVTDANGCAKTQTVVVTQPTQINVNSSGLFPSVCGSPNAVITLTAAGGYAPYAGLGTYSVSVGGTYTYTVTDSIGCIVQAFITVPTPSTLNVTPIITAPIACNGGTSTVYMNVIGGVAPYSQSGNITYSAGTYTYTVTDFIGCTASTTVTLSQPSIAASTINTIVCSSYTLPWGTTVNTSGTYTNMYTTTSGCDSTVTVNLTVSATNAISVSASASTILCFGDSSTIIVGATGGVMPYSGTGSFVRAANSNAYIFTVSDASGCNGSTSVVITQPSQINVNSAGLFPISCGSPNAAVTLSATGGVAPYTGLGTYTVSVGGTSTFTVTDSNGCIVQSFVTVPTPSTLSVTPIVTAPILCNAGTSTVYMNVTGGLAPYSQSGNITYSAGTYTYTVTDFIGCTTSTVITLTEPPVLFHNDTVSNCGSYTLPWGSTVTSSGTYTNMYTASNTCDSLVSFNVTIINGSAASTLNLSNCDSVTLPWGLTVYASGTYIHLYPLGGGCDSTVTAVVNINYTSITTLSLSACDSLTLPWGTVVTTSGNYAHGYAGSNGCDSIVTANVTINNSATYTSTVSATGNFLLPWGTTVTASGTYTNTYTAVNGCDSIISITVTVVNNPVILCAKAFLSGAFVSSNTLMHDSLRVKNLLPSVEPYSSMPFAPSYQYTIGNGNIIQPNVLLTTGSNAIVDWVFVQVRDASNSSVILFKQAALIQRDGDIVDVDGISHITLTGLNAGNYYVSVKHRNHLGVMTANPVYLSSTPNCVDFTSVNTSLFAYTGSASNASPLTGSSRLINGYRALYGGNCSIDIGSNAHRVVSYGSLSTSDRALMLSTIGGTSTLNGYTIFDCDLNGYARFNGLQPDRLIILSNLANNNLLTTKEQTPN